MVNNLKGNRKENINDLGNNQTEGIANLKANRAEGISNLVASQVEGATNRIGRQTEDVANFMARQIEGVANRIGNQPQMVSNLKANQAQSITNLKRNQSQNTIANKKEVISSNRTGKSIINERLTVEWIFPIEQLLEMEINQQRNEHGKLYIKAILPEGVQIESLTTAYQEHQIQIFDGIDENLPLLIFSGKVKNITYELQNSVLVAFIHGITYSIDLEQEKKYRSFQEISLSYEQVADEVTEEVGARFLWHMDRSRSIGRPFFQYEETDWEFCMRLASQFNCPIYADLTTGGSDIHFGIQRGIERNINGGEVLEYGFSNVYYLDGGYADEKQRGSYAYLRFKHDRLWQIGDTLQFRNQSLVAYERKIQFIKGELVYITSFGGSGLLWQKLSYNESLHGTKLQGIIRKIEKESVYVQFFFDFVEKADYPWPWVPEVGNLNYIMPEVGSLVTLSFSTNDEKDGLATELIRINSGSGVYRNEPNREFITAHDKMLGLHPERMIVRGEGQSASIVMDDGEGIAFRTPHGIRLNADGNISMSTGQLTVTASSQILMQNNQSNIELCKTFNLFAPSGVHSRVGAAIGVPPRRPASKGHPKNIQFANRALGAMPKIAAKKAVEEQAVSLVGKLSRLALGAIPAIASAPMIMGMNKALSGKKIESSSIAKSLSSSGNFTNNGGFFIPKVGQVLKARPSNLKAGGISLGHEGRTFEVGSSVEGITNLKAVTGGENGSMIASNLKAVLENVDRNGSNRKNVLNAGEFAGGITNLKAGLGGEDSPVVVANRKARLDIE